MANKIKTGLALISAIFILDYCAYADKTHFNAPKPLMQLNDSNYSTNKENNYAPVCTLFGYKNHFYLASKDRAWDLGEKTNWNNRQELDYIPPMPDLNKKILNVANIIEKKGKVIQVPQLWQSQFDGVKNPGYTKQLFFEDKNKTYFFNLDNYNENVSDKVDTLQIQIHNPAEQSIVFFGDAGLDGLLNYASNNHKFNTKPIIYHLEKDKFNTLKNTREYIEAINLFLTHYAH
ncbi:MAG: hypothetical protein ACOYT4_04775 [Nanoarchaeota archaeon]